MMTEDEAKQKWCPQYREWEGDNRPRAWDGKERSSDLKTIHTTAMCIGSACMAWRWMPAKLDDATPIAELELSIRTVNALQQAGVQTVADLRRIPPVDFLRMRNVGRVTLAEIESILRGPPPSYLNQPQRGYCGLAGRPA